MEQPQLHPQQVTCCCHGVDIPNDPATFEVYAMISAKCSRSLQLRCDTNQDAQDCPKLLIFYPCNFYTAFLSAKILKYHQPCPPYVDTIPDLWPLEELILLDHMLCAWLLFSCILRDLLVSSPKC